jgi:flagellar motor switch protein FliM
MDSQEHISVMRRKAGAGRDGAGGRGMSASKALRLALAQAADARFDLAVNVATVEQMRVSPGEIAGRMAGEGLLLLLDGREGARAMLRLDPQVLAALIEVQTTGQVRPGIARSRPATPTDAAMVAAFVDTLMAQYDAQKTQGIAGHVARDFRFGDRIEDVRAMMLVLPAVEHDLFRLTVDLGSRAKSGQIDLLLPVAPARPQRAEGASGARDREGIAQMALNAPVVLDAVMARVPVMLRDVSAFRRGQIVPLSPEVLATTYLVASKGHVVAKVHLGQMNGWRAVRLISTEVGEMPVAQKEETVAQPAPLLPLSAAGAELVPYADPAQVAM